MKELQLCQLPGTRLTSHSANLHIAAREEDIVGVLDPRARLLIVGFLQRPAQFCERALQHGQPLPPQRVVMLVLVTMVYQMDQFRSLLQSFKPDLHLGSRGDDTVLHVVTVEISRRDFIRSRQGIVPRITQPCWFTQ